MSSTSAAANVKKINPAEITERYSNLSRPEIVSLGRTLLRDPRIIALLEGKGIKDTSHIQLIFGTEPEKQLPANSLPPTLRSMMLKPDITNLISKMQLKGKEPDILFTVLDEIIEDLAALGGGRRRRNRKTKRARKTRRTRRNNKKRSA
jgi:hypothetical protein